LRRRERGERTSAQHHRPQTCLPQIHPSSARDFETFATSCQGAARQTTIVHLFGWWFGEGFVLAAAAIAAV
jgi:hypothetical protein